MKLNTVQKLNVCTPILTFYLLSFVFLCTPIWNFDANKKEFKLLLKEVEHSRFGKRLHLKKYRDPPKKKLNPSKKEVYSTLICFFMFTDFEVESLSISKKQY